MKFLKRLILLSLLTVCLLPLYAHAEEIQAENISGSALVQTSSGFNGTGYLFDGKIYYGKTTPDAASVTLAHENGIGSLYIIFDETDTRFTVTDETKGIVCTVEAEPYYHRFVDLTELFGETPTNVTLSFDDPVAINEIYAFTEGEVPSWVQRWQAPAEGEADLVLFSAHGDDEQLFFCGILPYYSQEMGYKVQVVYLTDHRENDPYRIHEMLDGLWNVGVRYYPVYHAYPDFIRLHEKNGTYDGFYARGYTKEELIGYVVENLRRFKPSVAVGHDINGEYGHGMHMMYCDMLMEAVAISNDPESYPESAGKYGLWDTPKTYLHLYEENPIVMDWDVPLESFGGMTAYQVSKEIGFPSHASQLLDFAWYYSNYKTAAELPKYNPCYYGLYRSTVGEDVQKNDFFENVICHTEEAKLEAIRLQEEEEARQKAEEEARIRAEEERIKAEAEAKERAKQEAERELQEQLAREAELAHRKKVQMWFLAGGAAAAVAAILLAILSTTYHRKK